MRNFPNYLRFYKDEWHALEVPKVEFTRRKNAVEWEKWHFIAAAKLWLREREKKEKKGKKKKNSISGGEKREKIISLSVRSRNNVSREKVLNKSVPSSCKLVSPDSKYETTISSKQTKILLYQRIDFSRIMQPIHKWKVRPPISNAKNETKVRRIDCAEN